MSAAGEGTGAEHRPTFGVARMAEETRERFVREIIARVPLARTVELYLFSPMRQGGMESGVAVLAATIDVSLAPIASTPESPAEGSLETLPASPAPAPDAAVDPVPDGDPTELAAGAPPDHATPSDDEAQSSGAPPVEAALEAVLEAVPERAPDPARRPAVRRRLTVFTARYRLVVKGPERGKWDVEVREEADAPLVTVEAVVRGVQQRAGDASEPDRMDATSVARMLGLPLPDPGAPPAP
ncbi:MAG: hypothetical protein ACXW61_11145 [Gemmatirosa sp.]